MDPVLLEHAVDARRWSGEQTGAYLEIHAVDGYGVSRVHGRPHDQVPACIRCIFYTYRIRIHNIVFLSLQGLSFLLFLNLFICRRTLLGIAMEATRGLCVKQKLNPLNLKCIGFKRGVSNGVPRSNGVSSACLQRVVVEEVMKQSSPKPISLLGSRSSIQTHVVCFHLWYVVSVV